ncbi:MAG: rRNA pseudouridine synthase [Xanthomonadales bacterium]|nr:rRNA pseudouridine synthase [Xanthomonadales bacterium]MCC6561030.1 rRNA pseudouridine synthase [Xanthomonadales bacterium]
MATHYGLARILSKRGLCSRTEAARWIAAGRVRVAGRVVRDAEAPTTLDAEIVIDGEQAELVIPLHLMLNKRRGLITTRMDEHGRATVYDCFANANLPWVAPVGRLDRASEGLLLFSNDPGFAASINEPGCGIEKTYHVQVGGLPTAEGLAELEAGLSIDGECWRALRARELRRGAKNCWLEIVLDEGRNRQIRRMLETLGYPVMRLVRVAIGALQLGPLDKGEWRVLGASDIAALHLPAPASGG